MLTSNKMKNEKEIEAMAAEMYPIKCIENKDCIHEWCTIKKIERQAFIQGFKQCQEISDWVSVETPPKDGEIYDIVCWWKDSHKIEERKGYIFKEKHGVVDWINFFQQFGFYNNGLYEESFGLDENIITHYRIHQPLPSPPQKK